MSKWIRNSILIFLTVSVFGANAQDTVHYVGETLVNIDYHHGQLSPALGVHNIQVMRANREQPQYADDLGWTYNHAPNLAYWNNTFYYHYLNDPVGEHIPPGRTMLQTSKDGYNWTKPVTLFPEYKVPNGFTKEGVEGRAKNLVAVMHQRMGFFVSSDNRLLTLAFYGISLNEKDSPNDGNGIGRAVREINEDGSFGPIYFIRYNHGWSEENTDFPFYKSCDDKGFVDACDEMLADPLQMQQWVEEADRDDPLIPIQKEYKAFNFYHVPDGTVVGLWKHALTATSTDEGKTWTVPLRAPGFVNANAKIWGQRTSDGKYLTVYNPSEFRWPLALSVSNDGFEYDKLLLVNGEISTMRYGGNYKSYGPQYVRGIQEGNGTPPDGNAWVAYSMNKEDMWISRIKVPVLDREAQEVNEVFSEIKEGTELDRWNIYSPVWAPVKIEKIIDERVLSLKDKDEFDFAKATRLFPSTKQADVEFTIKTGQNNTGKLDIELQDAKNTPAIRLTFDNDGYLKYKAGYRVNNLREYEAGKEYIIRIVATTEDRFYNVYINGEQVLRRLFFAPVHELNKIVFRTGDVRRFPNADTPTDQDYDVKQNGKPLSEAAFYIKSLKTQNAESAAILKADDYKHYVDYFNGMEDENIIQMIPNSESWKWMKKNIPLFECPQENFEELFYYRWWNLRKHIKETPVGLAMTEFLVERSYSDKYNLIACAIGHHTYESRWLHNPEYVKQNLKVWYRGNEGGPMNKLHKFSSWTPDAVYNYYLLTRDTDFVVDLLPDLEADYRKWEQERRKPRGMFWQEDVKDGMEEQISGGRRVKNERPTINSYMFGNAVAISKMAALAGKPEWEKLYAAKADTMKQLVEQNLWNPESNFFETVKEEGGFAEVREAIGYIPWYFNLPEKGYEKAWEQVKNPAGFLAPFGLTTAEQRHPEFRTHGCCKCEWDGAVWPFATSQTLTGMANLLNNYNQNVVNDSVYFDLLETYVESQYYRGRPYIGEYLDETTGYWLKGDQERSRYYNHSTFNDLLITGLVGLRPRADEKVEVNPLIPENKWNWFCLDNVLYHGKTVTIVWDKNGDKYELGKGLFVLIDGKVAGHSENIGRIICDL
ncbi:MGH1-like glycoside hydrolase domain-containing protein [Maribellus sediminis]|uniref:MGH1-like glycoside hydrolase domain-containing protein n=1 Tax=Maribellus sediminis TaxID=2696285 RepID=UPI00143062E7|nr:exo-alpha-sialidase [Maribellus sediminis]